MSIELYAIHIAPRGSKIDAFVDQINAERAAARDKRMEYGRSKGAVGVYANEDYVSGLIFKSEQEVPDGWEVVSRQTDTVAASPKAKDRTKAERERVKAAKAELASLPALSGAPKFTRLIGSDACIIRNEVGGFSMAHCWFHRIEETTFVMTPWVNCSSEDMLQPCDKKAFHPEGCERVGLSVYYAAKEKAEAKAVAA